MNPRQRTVALCDAAAMAEAMPFKFKCGRCGAAFDTKSAKAKHKLACRQSVQTQIETPCEDEHLYADMRRHSSARVIALANAEWAAMNWRGELPDDWPERRAELERALDATQEEV